MANIPTTRVTLGRVITDLGVVCKDPTVTLIGYPNVYVNCIDQENGIYEVQLPENEDLKCLEFSVDCNDDCRNCDPQIIKKCFCDDTGDCQDCAVCNDEGFCDPLCADEFCCDGACRECCTSTQCPCNQICDANGNCVCPDDTKKCDPSDDCCVECCDADDCPACYICVDGSCEPKDCPNGICDPSCTPTDTDDCCVECITADQCDVNECCEENECVCCPGFVRNVCTGLCVPLPPNSCQTDEDCPECSDCTEYDPCTGYGVCTPKVCPPGTVAVVHNGVCICATECDCEDPGCDIVTEFCKDFGSDVCACVPCAGNCTDGCEDEECYCNPTTDQCEENPCVETTCVTGVDCGEGCGCDPNTNQCVPCGSISCANENDCDRILGCECVNDVCQESDGCTDVPCSTPDDCPQGCGCDQGSCVPCDNFPCNPDLCSDIEGCECVGGDCQDDNDPCTDTLVLTKDNSNCTLTGTLTKDNCCQCPELTLDSKGRLFSETTDNATLNFILEVRKGAYDGVNVASVPRVDEFTNENIAENEPPTAGTIQLAYTVTYDVFETSSGQRVYTGTTTTSAVTQNATFPGLGNTAEVAFNGIVLPKIDSELTVGSEVHVTKRVEVTFTLINTLEFPNTCDYTEASVLTRYIITNNAQYSAFPSASLGNAKAKVIATDGCRIPFFKWTKSSDAVFNETPFRKLYVTGGPNVYTDVLDGVDDDLESCFYYHLESDCNCDDPQSMYVVFCNPENLDFTLSPATCPNCITINSFDPCDVNEDLTYRVQAGSVDLTFTEATAPIGQLNCSVTPFTEVIYTITCDAEEICKKTYDIGQGALVITPTTECNAESTQFTVTFPSTDDSAVCNVDHIEIANSQGQNVANLVTPPFTTTLPVGTYNVVVYWACGCAPTVMQLQEDCCEFTLDPITRGCEECGVGEPNCYDTTNGSLNCQETAGVTYTLNGATIVAGTVCQTLAGLPDTQFVQVIATKGNCLPATINLQTLADLCCENFGFDMTQTPVTTIVTVTGSNGTVTVTAFNDTTQQALTVVDNGNGTYTVSGYSSGDQVTVTVIDPICGQITDTFIGSTGGCDLDVVLEQFTEGVNCRLRAVATAEECLCRVGNYTINITDVEKIGDNFHITYNTLLGLFDANPVSGELFVGIPDSETARGFINGTETIIIPIPTTPGPEECLAAQLELTMFPPCNLDDGLCQNSCNQTGTSTPRSCDAGTTCASQGASPDCICTQPSAPPGSGLGQCICQGFGGVSDVQIRVMQGGDDLIDLPNIQSVNVTFNGTPGIVDIRGANTLYTLPACCPAGLSINVGITVQDTDGVVYTLVYTWSGPTADCTPQLVGVSICGETTTQPEFINVDFDLRGLSLEDNCDYPDSTATFTIWMDESVQPSTTQVIGLSPTIENARWIKFEWIRNNAGPVIFREFVGATGSYTSTLPFAETVVGDTYDVTATCDNCDAEDEIVLCCIPEVVTVMHGCNERLDITLNGNPGDYDVTYDGISYPVTIPVSGTITLAPILGAPELDQSTGLIALSSNPSCSETFTVDLVSAGDDACNPTPDYVPTYSPGYAPTGPYTPTYTPIYTAPVYSPTSSPTPCLGCVSSMGFCCGDLITEGLCNTQGTCIWTLPGDPAGTCECDTSPGQPAYAPSYTPIYLPTVGADCAHISWGYASPYANGALAFNGITINGSDHIPLSQIYYATSVHGKVEGAAERIAQFIGNSLAEAGETWSNIYVKIHTIQLPPSNFQTSIDIAVHGMDGSVINSVTINRYNIYTPTPGPATPTVLVPAPVCVIPSSPDVTLPYQPYTPTYLPTVGEQIADVQYNYTDPDGNGAVGFNGININGVNYTPDSPIIYADSTNGENQDGLEAIAKFICNAFVLADETVDTIYLELDSTIGATFTADLQVAITGIALLPQDGDYVPTYIPIYTEYPIPAYSPSYSTPTYSPAIPLPPTYTPTYTPVYTQMYAPTYTPTYGQVAVSIDILIYDTWTPAPVAGLSVNVGFTSSGSIPLSPDVSLQCAVAYSPTYAPIYGPSYAPSYVPIYAPSYTTPTYAPVYTESYAPNYAPSYTTPTYAPIYAPTYTPGYTPSYTTPTYTPSGYAPTYTTPTYTPIYVTPTYTPIYAETYTPLYIPTYTDLYAPIYTPVYAPTYVPIYTPAVGVDCARIHQSHIANPPHDSATGFHSITINGNKYTTDYPIVYTNSIDGDLPSVAPRISQFIRNALIQENEVFTDIEVQIFPATIEPDYVSEILIVISDIDGEIVDSYEIARFNNWSTSPLVYTPIFGLPNNDCTGAPAPDITDPFVPAYTPTYTPSYAPSYTPTPYSPTYTPGTGEECAFFSWSNSVGSTNGAASGISAFVINGTVYRPVETIVWANSIDLELPAARVVLANFIANSLLAEGIPYDQIEIESSASVIAGPIFQSLIKIKVRGVSNTTIDSYDRVIFSAWGPTTTVSAVTRTVITGGSGCGGTITPDFTLVYSEGYVPTYTTDPNLPGSPTYVPSIP